MALLAHAKKERTLLDSLGWTPAHEDQFVPHAADGLEPARVAVEHRGAYLLYTARGEAQAELAGRLRHAAAERGELPAVGDWVAIAELLPWNNGYPEADPKIRHLNELIRALAHEEGVPVLPFYETLEDPDRPGRMKEEWTPDGDHPSVEGYRLLGEQAFPASLGTGTPR
jgi:lysophospholipase L1-like esterase